MFGKYEQIMIFLYKRFHQLADKEVYESIEFITWDEFTYGLEYLEHKYKTRFSPQNYKYIK